MENNTLSAVNTVISFSSNFPQESPKIRYSDTELNEFKKVILKKLEGAEIYYQALKESLQGTFGESLDTSPIFKPYQDASSVYEKEQLGKTFSEQEILILKLNAALVRIEQKNYGICRETGQLIPKERLRAVPHATLSIQGKKEEKKTPKWSNRR